MNLIKFISFDSSVNPPTPIGKLIFAVNSIKKENNFEKR